MPYDLTLTLWLNLPFFILLLLRGNSKLLQILFLFFNLSFFFIAMIDATVFMYLAKHLDKDLLSLIPGFFKAGGQGLMISEIFWDLFYFALINLGVLVLFFFIYFKGHKKLTRFLKKSQSTDKGKKIGFLTTQAISFTILILGVFASWPIITGNFQVKQLVQLGPYILDNAFHPSLDFLISSFQRKEKQNKTDLSWDLPTSTQFQQPLCKNPFKAQAKGRNLMIITVESLNASYLSSIRKNLVNKKPHKDLPPVMPFLDSLAQKSLFFPKVIAQASGSASSNFISLLSSLFPSQKHLNTSLSLGRLLGENGYSRNYFIGERALIFETFKIAQITGFKRLHDSRNFMKKRGRPFVKALQKQWGENIQKNEKGLPVAWGWGVPDHLSLDYALEHLEKEGLEKPWAAVFFTASTHRPYYIPPSHLARLKHTDKVFKAYEYTDLVLKDFFKAHSSKSWFQNTLFVIMADHRNSDPFLSKKSDVLERKQIPLLIYRPWLPKGKTFDKWVLQSDLSATIAELLDLEGQEKLPLYTQSLVSPCYEESLMFSHNKAHWIIEEDLGVAYSFVHKLIFYLPKENKFKYINELTTEQKKRAHKMIQKLKSNMA